MKLEEVVAEIRLSVATIKEKLDHTVTWKELSGTALALFGAICLGVWFLVGQSVDSRLSGSEARLKAASIDAVDVATKKIMAELKASLSEVSDKIEKQQTTLLEVSASLGKMGNGNPYNPDFYKQVLEISEKINSIGNRLTDNPQTNAAYVTFNASGSLGAKVLASPEWDNFAKTWGLDTQSVVNTGQIIVPFGDIGLLPKN